MKKINVVGKKHKIVTMFQNQGGANAPPSNDVNDFHIPPRCCNCPFLTPPSPYVYVQLSFFINSLRYVG